MESLKLSELWSKAPPVILEIVLHACDEDIGEHLAGCEGVELGLIARYVFEQFDMPGGEDSSV